MRMKATLETGSLDLKMYKQQLSDYLSDQIKDAIRVWLNATVRSVVPTWSGASRATFEKIARLAGETIAYGPQKSRTDRKPLGRRESEGRVIIKPNSGFFSFTWSTSLRYFILNNYTHQVYEPGAKDTGDGVILSPSGLTHPGPYRLDEKGQTALEGFVQGIELPNPYLTLKKKTVRV